jgi:hypothetical protein
LPQSGDAGVARRGMIRGRGILRRAVPLRGIDERSDQIRTRYDDDHRGCESLPVIAEQNCDADRASALFFVWNANVSEMRGRD